MGVVRAEFSEPTKGKLIDLNEEGSAATPWGRLSAAESFVTFLSLINFAFAHLFVREFILQFQETTNSDQKLAPPGKVL